MTNNNERKQFIRRYLLGGVSLEERRGFEREYFEDNDLFEELVDVRNTLVDSYAHGELPEDEKRTFEAQFRAVPERLQRVRFAEAMAVHASAMASALPNRELQPSPPDQSRPWNFLKLRFADVRVAMSAILLLALAYSAWVTVANRSLGHRISEMRSSIEQDRLQNQELSREVGQLKTQLEQAQVTSADQAQQIAQLQPPGQEVAFLALTSDIARSTGEQPTVALSSHTSKVSLQLDALRNGYSAYLVSIETVEGKQIWQRLVPSQGSHDVRIVTAAAPLKSGDYILKAFGFLADGTKENAGVYSFRVTRK